MDVEASREQCGVQDSRERSLMHLGCTYCLIDLLPKIVSYFVMDISWIMFFVGTNITILYAWTNKIHNPHSHDRSMLQVIYSNNHNLYRTIGFMAVLAADPRLNLGMQQLSSFKTNHGSMCMQKGWHGFTFDVEAKVWNIRPGGVLVFAPPCSSWVFLSSSSTQRSWSQPQGNNKIKLVKLANIFVQRMLYMLLGAFVFVL